MCGAALGVISLAEGKLTYGDGVATKDARVRLASTENPYRPISRMLLPERHDIAGAPPEDQSADKFIRRWTQDRWERGELKGLWEPGGYRQSSNVKPDREGDRLELGAFKETTNHDGPAAFSEGMKFGKAHSLLWAVDDATAHWWQLATDDWDQTGWNTGAGGADTVTSLCDSGDGLVLYIAFDDKDIRKVATGANSTHFAGAGATYNAELCYAQGTVYYLDGADLYSLTTGSTDTRVVLSQPGGNVADYMASSANLYRRMCVTDVGVAWLIPQEDGTTIIYEYNAKNSTDYASGKLPVEFATPYSIYFAHGFLFVGFRYAAAHGEKGAAHIYYQRGGQWGSTGEIRNADTSTASQPVIIAGVIGDDLIFWYGKSLMAYDLSAGALFQVAESGGTSTGVTDAATFGKDIFVANTDGSAAVERFDTTLYSTGTASWKSGRFDFDLPGVKKTLLRVTVVVDALPASTSMTCKVSADGGTFTAVNGTLEDDGDTTFTWTVSKSGNTEQQTTGYDFEIELIPLTTNSSNSPQVREIFAEAISAQKRRGVEIDVDLRSSTMAKGASGTALLAQLRAASEYSGGIVSWSDPYAVAEHEAPRVSDVMVELLAGQRDQEFATIRVRETSLV